jgi:hypothetical protein
MTHTVQFSHTETLYASLPGLEIEVKYQGFAVIREMKDVEVSCEIVTLQVYVNNGPFEDAAIPSAKTVDGNRFLGPLRDSARRNLRRMQAQGFESRYAHAYNFPAHKIYRDDD